MNAGIFAMLFVGGGLALVVGGLLFRVRDREQGAGRDPRPALRRARRPARGADRGPQPARRGHHRPGRQDGRPVRREGRHARRPRAGPHPDAAGRVRRHHRRRATLALAAILYGLTGTWSFGRHRPGPRPTRSPCSFVRLPDRQAAQGLRGRPARRPDADRLVAVGRPHVPAGHPDDVRGGRAAACPRSSPGSSPRPAWATPSSTPSTAWPSAWRSATSTGSCRPSASSRRSAAGWPTCCTRWPTSSGPARRCAARSPCSPPRAGSRPGCSTALAPFMFLAIQVISPGYMEPMFQGWGLVVLGVTGAPHGLRLRHHLPHVQDRGLT